MSTKILAPFTPEQCDALNAFQHDGAMHPFTCADSTTHPDQSVTLVAWPDGWACPAAGCNYHQGWAHAFMADPRAALANAWYPGISA